MAGAPPGGAGRAGGRKEKTPHPTPPPPPPPPRPPARGEHPSKPRCTDVVLRHLDVPAPPSLDLLGAVDIPERAPVGLVGERRAHPDRGRGPVEGGGPG